MAQTKYLDIAGLQYYDSKIKAYIATNDTEVLDRSAVTIANAVTPDSGDAATLVVTQNWTTEAGVSTPTEIGRIHIPLDKYVSAGAVATRQVENPETHELETKTYIDLTVTNGAGASGSSTVSIDISSVAGDISAIQHAIDILNGNDQTQGSVAYSIRVALEALDSEVITSGTPSTGQVLATATVATGDVNVLTGVTEADGKLSAATATTLKKLASTAAAEDATTAAITDGDPTDPQTLYAAGTVQSTLEAIARDVAGSDVTVEKDATATTGYISSYTIKQGGQQVGVKIDIPKDYLVKSAKIVEYALDDVTNKYYDVINDPQKEHEIDALPTGVTVGKKYIDFVINSKDGSGEESHIYLDVADLAHVYTAAPNASEIQIAISADDVISASVVDVPAAKVSIVDQAGNFTATDVEGALAELAEAAAGTNGAFVFKGTSPTVPTTGEKGFAYLVGTAPNVKLMICTTASTASTDATYTEIAIDTAMTGTGFQTAGNSEAATPIAPAPLTIKEYVDKLIFVGTQAEYDAAVAAGTLLTNTFAVITDDAGNELTPISDSEIDDLFD